MGASAPAQAKHLSKGGALALGICVSILVLLGGWFLIRYLKRQRDHVFECRAPPQPTSQTDPDLFIELLLQSQETRNQGTKRIASALERLATARRESPRASAAAAAAAAVVAGDEIFNDLEEHLTCPICTTVFYNPVSVITVRTNQNDWAL